MARIQVGKVAGVIQQSPTLAVVVSLGLRTALYVLSLTPTTVTAEGPYSYSCVLDHDSDVLGLGEGERSLDVGG
ncbi:hypothetical protein V8E36_009481 [Tilletia maclaganii]